MAYIGFVGSGHVGNFSSTGTLELVYPAQRNAGRKATVETAGVVAWYFSTGAAWTIIQAGPQIMTLPGDFDWTPSFNVLRSSAGQYDVSITAESLRPSVGTLTTYYSFPLTGLNTNNGLTPATAFQTVGKAQGNLTSVGTTRVLVYPGTTRTINGTLGYNGIRPQRNCIVESCDINGVPDGLPLWFIAGQNAGPPTWTATGTPNQWTTPISTSSVTAKVLIDAKLAAQDLTGLTDPLEVVSVADATINGTTPGSFFQDTANGLLYFHPADGRNMVGDVYVSTPLVGASLNCYFNVEASMANARRYWLNNCFMVGGNAISGTNGDTATSSTIIPEFVMKGGGFWGATGNGMAFVGAYDVYLFDVRNMYNGLDGENFHGNTNSTGNVRALMVRSISQARDGYSGLNIALNTNNNSTGHELCRLIRVMCAYAGSEGRPVHDIQNVHSLMFGGTAGISASSQLINASSNYPNVQAGLAGGEATFIDMYEVTVPQGPNTALSALTGSAIRCHGMDITGLTVSGNVTSVAL